MERDEHYCDFAPAITDRGQIKTVIESDAGVQAKEDELTKAFHRWWGRQRDHLAWLPDTQDRMVVRASASMRRVTSMNLYG